MRTAEERLRLISRRTASLRRARSRRRRLAIDALCAVGCLVLIVCMGSALAGLETDADAPGMLLPTGTASLLASGEALGYVLMGVMAFVLGVCVTVLLYRLRRRRERRWYEGDDDEL